MVVVCCKTGVINAVCKTTGGVDGPVASSTDGCVVVKAGTANVGSNIAPGVGVGGGSGRVDTRLGFGDVLEVFEAGGFGDTDRGRCCCSCSW